ncbi:MAG: Lrp/AsnC family transcriptional regulator, partial [Oscillospiraceae bacterium]
MDKLLKLLDTNCRYTISQLAAMADMSETDVKISLENYEKKGIIRGYKAIIDWDKTDRDYVTALIEIKVSPKANEGFDEIAKKIMRFDEVESVSLMSGGFDLCAIVRGK